jgi:hypothetical protein
VVEEQRSVSCEVCDSECKTHSVCSIVTPAVSSSLWPWINNTLLASKCKVGRQPVFVWYRLYVFTYISFGWSYRVCSVTAYSLLSESWEIQWCGMVVDVIVAGFRVWKSEWLFLRASNTSSSMADDYRRESLQWLWIQHELLNSLILWKPKFDTFVQSVYRIFARWLSAGVNKSLWMRSVIVTEAGLWCVPRHR